MRPNTFDDRYYYQYLNIDRNAIPEVVTAAYRGLMKKYHPDLNGGDKEAEEKAKKINEAYEVLSDPVKRKEYDRWLDSIGDSSGSAGRRQYENNTMNNTRNNRTMNNRKSAGTGSSQKTSQAAAAQGYQVDFDYIRSLVFPGYETWHSAKFAARKREAENKKRAMHLYGAVFALLCLVIIGGAGYIYRDQLPDWIKKKIPGVTSGVQTVTDAENGGSREDGSSRETTAYTNTAAEHTVDIGSEASAEYMGMIVTAKLTDSNQVLLTFANNTSTEFSIGGWERPQEACLETTNGEYWTKFNTWMGFDISSHSTKDITLSFENVQGNVKSLTIHEITSLVNGLLTFGRAADVKITFE